MRIIDKAAAAVHDIIVRHEAETFGWPDDAVIANIGRVDPIDIKIAEAVMAVLKNHE